MIKGKKILRFFLITAIIIASLRIALFSLRFFLGTEQPIVVVDGPSMEPFLYDGDVLILRGVQDKQDIKLQDIIVFHEPYGKGRLIVHRVVEIISNTQVEFITKGDNNFADDLVIFGWKVREVDVVGVYLSKVPPFLGAIVVIIESQPAIIFSIVIIIIALGVDIFSDQPKKGPETNFFIKE